MQSSVYNAFMVSFGFHYAAFIWNHLLSEQVRLHQAEMKKTFSQL